VRIYVRFLVEEAQFLKASAAVRWLRRSSPNWPPDEKKKWDSFLREPYTRMPLDPAQDEWLPLTHTWSVRWNAPIYFFSCPFCYKRVRRLLRLNDEDQWGCRRCHRAKYASQLRNLSALGIAHLRLAEHVDWLLSQPGPRTRSMARLERRTRMTEPAFVADWERFARRLLSKA